ncbi:MAG: M20 family metallopeptidase [Verrucomicrobiales bacterium]
MPDDIRLQRIIDLTRDLILIPSTEHAPAERKRVMQMLQNRLDGIPGIRFQWHEHRGSESLVVLPEGIDAPEILLSGHIDVVHHGDESVYRSEVAGGRIVGPGAGDMKGQVAILVALLAALHRRAPGVSVGLAITSDEEVGGEDGMGYLFGEAGLRCGVLILPDGGSLNDVTVEEKGIAHLRVIARGRSSHGARPWLASNALHQLMDAVARIRSHFPMGEADAAGNHWFPTCSATRATVPNDQNNMIPDYAEAVLDVRFPPPHTLADILAAVRGAAGDGVAIEPIVTSEATRLAPDPDYLRAVEEITGQPCRTVKASGGSDARFAADCGIPVILSRPLVGEIHGTREWIDIASMEAFYRINLRYIERRLETRKSASLAQL